MNTTHRTTACWMAAALSAFMIVGCDSRDDRTAGEKLDAAVAETKQETAEARADASAAMDRAGEKVENAAAGMGNTMDDAGITAKVNAAFAGDPKLSAMKIDVDTEQGRVALSGTAPDAQARDRATELALAVEGVKGVDNNLQLGR
ncbi:MAG: BON domain-containing protein [Burkholderiales bacterium]|nr:BON domain-containing protein [Burkholderiales bacterium]